MKPSTLALALCMCWIDPPSIAEAQAFDTEAQVQPGLQDHVTTGFNAYQPLVSSGTVPLDVRQYYLETSEFAKEERERSKDRFVSENSAALGYLVATGRVLYNDPLSVYTSAVLDTLLLHDKGLRARIRVFVLRSSVVNAFTTNDGKIFVTVGLLARIHDNAELGFVLAHEIEHYVHGDIYDSFKWHQRLRKDMKELGSGRESADAMLRMHYKRSKEQEIRADSAGMVLYLQSPFSDRDPSRIFEVLGSADRAMFDEVPQADFFTDAASILQPVFEDPLQRDTTTMVQDTAHSTHPSISTRLGLMRLLGHDHGWSLSTKQDGYRPVRTLAGLELAYTYYIDGDQVAALIQTNGMLQDLPRNPFLLELAAKCIHEIAMRRPYHDDASDTATAQVVNDPVTEGFRRSLARIHRSELFAAVLHRCVQVDTAAVDMDIRYIAAQAKRSLGLRRDGTFNTTTSDTAINARLREAIRALRSRSTAVAILEKSAKDLQDPPKDLDDLQGHLVLPAIYIMDTLMGKWRIIEPQRAYGEYYGRIRRIPDTKDLQVMPLSSFGLLENETMAYNDYCFLSDQLNAVLSSGERVQCLDRDRAYALAKRYNARYVTLSFNLFTKNTTTYKVNRIISWTLSTGPVAAHAFFCNYTGRHFNITYDIWTGEMISQAYSLKRSYNRPSPKARPLIRALEQLNDPALPDPFDVDRDTPSLRRGNSSIDR